MLFLTRKVGQSIIINDDITLTITEIRPHSVKISFDFPKSVRVLRQEVYERIKQENEAAQNQADILVDLIQARKKDISSKTS